MELINSLLMYPFCFSNDSTFRKRKLWLRYQENSEDVYYRIMGCLVILRDKKKKKRKKEIQDKIMSSMELWRTEKSVSENLNIL